MLSILQIDEFRPTVGWSECWEVARFNLKKSLAKSIHGTICPLFKETKLCLNIYIYFTLSNNTMDWDTFHNVCNLYGKHDISTKQFNYGQTS
jgi:hypothetical protein